MPRAALPRPAPTPGSYNCRLIKLGKATAKTQAVRKLQAILLLRRGRGRSADHRQADRQPAPGGTPVGGRRRRPPDFPRQPGARRRAAAARLWRRSQARHGRRARADRAVQMAAGDPVAAEHVEARRVRADAGRAISPAAMSDERSRAARRPARGARDPGRIAPRRASRSAIPKCSACSATISRGPRCARCARCWPTSTTRPRSAASPSLRCWWCASRTGCRGRAGGSAARRSTAITGQWEGPKAAKLIRKLQSQAFDYWAGRERLAFAKRRPWPKRRTFTVSRGRRRHPARPLVQAAHAGRQLQPRLALGADRAAAARRQSARCPGDRVEAGQEIRVPPPKRSAGAVCAAAAASASR